MNKIEKFIKRNRNRNKHLWENDKIEGYDYIVCPVTKSRLSMLKKNYIEKTLEMSIDDFYKKYPNQQKICNKRIENIKYSLQKKDLKTGLTKHQLSVRKSRTKLESVGDDGLTGDERRAIKTRESNLNNIINGKNGYQRTAEKRNNTILKNGLSIQQNGLLKNLKKQKENGNIANFEHIEEWNIYRDFVKYLSYKKLKVKQKYHIDHIYSICSGFNDKISPYIISNLSNLQYLSVSENTSKGIRCDINIKELLKKCNKTKKENDNEYIAFQKVIKSLIKNKSFISYIKLNKLIKMELKNV